MLQNVPKFREFLLALNKQILICNEKREEHRHLIKTGDFNPLIRGKTFVLTGFYGRMDFSLEDHIYDNLGNFSDTVTSSISAVIAANVMDSSKKMFEAQKLGVKVLSLEEFRKAYKVPSKATDGGDDEGDGEGDEAKLGIRHEEDDD